MPKAFSVVATNFATYPGQWSPIKRRVELYSLVIRSCSQQRAYCRLEVNRGLEHFRVSFLQFKGVLNIGGVKIAGNCLAETCQCRGNLVWQRDPGFYVLIGRCHYLAFSS